MTSDINVAKTTMGRHASNYIHCKPKFVVFVMRKLRNGVRHISSKPGKRKTYRYQVPAFGGARAGAELFEVPAFVLTL